MDPSIYESVEFKLGGFARQTFGVCPTPLEPLPVLSEKLGAEIYVKRDDTIGPGMGGNKTRKLEYLMAEAMAVGARKVVTFGGLQSNHARITAAAARRCGLEPHLFYFEPRPHKFEGNLLLSHLLGARMHFIPLGGSGGMTLESTIRLVRWVARLMVGRNYFIPVGGHSALGCLGYVRAAQEIDTQAHQMGITSARIVLAAGSGGTLAGLMAGLALAGSSLGLLGIDVGKLWKGFPASIALLANQVSNLLGQEANFTAQDVPLIEERYVGECYGAPSPGGIEAMRTAARLEGLLLDPVYTAKAFAGMLDQVQSGKIGQDEPLIFLHTGGAPAAFAFGDFLG